VRDKGPTIFMNFQVRVCLFQKKN